MCPIRCLDEVLPLVWPSLAEPARPGGRPFALSVVNHAPLCSVEHRSRSAPVHYSAPRTHLGPEALRCKPTTALVSRVLSAEAPPASIWLLELIPRRFIGAASRWATTAKSMLRRSPSLRRIRSARQTPSRPAGRVSDAGVTEPRLGSPSSPKIPSMADAAHTHRC